MKGSGGTINKYGALNCTHFGAISKIIALSLTFRTTQSTAVIVCGLLTLRPSLSRFALLWEAFKRLSFSFLTIPREVRAHSLLKVQDPDRSLSSRFITSPLQTHSCGSDDAWICALSSVPETLYSLFMSFIKNGEPPSPPEKYT